MRLNSVTSKMNIRSQTPHHWFALILFLSLLSDIYGYEEIANHSHLLLARTLSSNGVHISRSPGHRNDGKLIGIRGDIVVRQSSLQHRQLLSLRSSTHDTLHYRSSTISNGTDQALSKGRNHLWGDLWQTIDSFKVEKYVWNTSSRRPTLTKHHMIVLPIWWNDETIIDNFDESYVSEMLNEVKTHYLDMSWNKHEISWEIWDRIILEGVTMTNADFDNSKTAVMNYVASKNRIEFQDYSGIVLMYNPVPNETSSFGFSGGWGGVNDNFLWMSIPGWFDVTRHEIGHNYGHPHHLTNTYDWRFSRGSEEFDVDGMDFMSGGNGYPIADFAAASKWFFNWVTDDAVVMMQPEGPTSYCPKCVSQVKRLTLRPFDSRNIHPSSRNKMAIHIPITGITNEWGAKTIYSYWLSYRSRGAGGISSKGLSVHISWFTLSGLFGASYDSLNYDAFGDTVSKFDSFVVNGTCYVITPSGLMNDVDPTSMEQIQPVVCVNRLNRFSSITISVSFLNSTKPPSSRVSLSSQRQLNCTRGGSKSRPLSLSMEGAGHLIRFKGTGANGTVSLSLCRKDQNSPAATVYFYDTFPIGYTSFDSPPGYGAYKSMKVTSFCSNRDVVEYQSEYDETYVLVRKRNLSLASQMSPILLSSTCLTGACSKNHYLNSFGECQECPAGSVSSIGAESIGDCIYCSVDGMVVENQAKSSNCIVQQNFVPFTLPAIEWRLFTLASLTELGWVWDVDYIQFFSSSSCSPLSKIDTNDGEAFDSGNAGDGYGPDGAFDEAGYIWGGRPNERNLYWIGWKFLKNITVKCVVFTQAEGNIANELWLQAKEKNEWKNVAFIGDLVVGDNQIVV